MSIRVFMKRRGVSIFSPEYNIGRILEINQIPFDDIRKYTHGSYYKITASFAFVRKNFFFSLKKVAEKSLRGKLNSYNFVDNEDNGLREYTIVIYCPRTYEQLIKVDKSLTKKEVEELEKLATYDEE